MVERYAVKVNEEQQKAWIEGYAVGAEKAAEYPNINCKDVVCGGCNVEECFLHSLYHKSKIGNFLSYSKDIITGEQGALNTFDSIFKRIKERM